MMDQVPGTDTERHVSHNRILACNTDKTHSLLQLCIVPSDKLRIVFQTPKCMGSPGQRLEVVGNLVEGAADPDESLEHFYNRTKEAHPMGRV